MKKLLVAIILVLVNSEVFAIDQCPNIIRLAGLETITTLKENETFEMKGNTWTLTYSSGDW